MERTTRYGSYIPVTTIGIAPILIRDQWATHPPVYCKRTTIGSPELCAPPRMTAIKMQRVIVLSTHHVADDGVSMDLSGDRFHIGGSGRAEVAEDEMQIKIEGGNKGENIRHSYPTRRSKSASVTLRTPPSSRPRVASLL